MGHKKVALLPRNLAPICGARVLRFVVCECALANKGESVDREWLRAVALFMSGFFSLFALERMGRAMDEVLKNDYSCCQGCGVLWSQCLLCPYCVGLVNCRGTATTRTLEL